MPALKSIPIINPEDNSVVGQRFESSDSFLASLNKNYQPMYRPDGRHVRVNNKLAARGHYDDKGFTREAAPKAAKEKA